MGSSGLGRVLTAIVTLAIVFGLISPSPAAAVDGDAQAIATVSVTAKPTAAAVNRVTDRVYVVSQGTSTASNGTLTVISGADNSVIATVDVGANPSDVVVNESTNTIYVVNNVGNSVAVVNGATNAPAAALTVTNPLKAALDAGRSRLYVTTSSGLKVFDTTTNTETASVSGSTYGIAVNTSTNRLYVGNLDTGSGGSVTVRDAANPTTVFATISVGGEPNNIAVNETTGRVYVASSSGAALSVIDGATNTVVGTIALATASATEGLSVDASRNRLYVAHESASKLAIIDTTGGANTVLTQLPVGQFPQGAAVNTTTNRVYVPNFSSNSVSVVGAPAPSLPDLAVTSFTAPASVAPGGTASYTWTITNQGNGTANAVTAPPYVWADQVWLSTSPTSISNPAFPYGAGGITAPNSLAPGASYTRTFSATIQSTVPPGNYYFILQTDSNAQLAESNEGNNLSLAIIPVTVTRPGGPRITDARVTISTGIAGMSDAGDEIALTFDTAIDTGLADNVVRVTDGDGGSYALACTGTVVTGNGLIDAACTRSADGLVLTMRMLGDSSGESGAVHGTIPGLHWPGTIVATTGITDVAGTAVDLVASTDLLIDIATVTISAEVREDLDRDGVFDTGEPFLTAPRLEVFRIGANGSRTSVGAAVNSPNISVSGIAGGDFDVVETDPTGFVSTSPNTVRITVNTGSSLTRFMDARAGVSGIARHQETPNGTTIVDTLLPGATVTLLKPDGTKLRLAAGAGGAYAFPALLPNTRYTVGYDGTVGVAPNDRHYVTGLRFTTDAAGRAYVPSPQAVYNRKNHTWLMPFDLPNNDPVSDQVWRRGQATWYRFAITPQQQVTIELKGCAFNCDLVVYRDLQQVRAKLLADAQTQTGIRLTAQGDIMADDLDADDLDADDLDADDLDADDLDADDLDADDLDADDLDADDLDADDLDADDLDADDLDADDLDADDLDADDLDADDLDADDLDADDLDADDLDADDLDADDLDADDLDAGDGEIYVAAQRKGLRAASLTPGLAPETVVLNTRNLTGYLYVRVAGGSSLSGVFTVTARRTTDLSCVTAPLINRQPSTTFGAAVAGKRSLILTDTLAYGLAGAEKSAFLTKLATFAAHATVLAQVVDLADDPGYQQLRADWALARACVAQANLATDAIRGIVQRFRAASTSFEYLINAGGDAVIPFRRVADWAEISRESKYSPPLNALSASEASLVADTFLSDDFYVSSAVESPNRTLYLPDIATGRLVESVTEVGAYIDMYLAAGGVAAPTRALSSGYDFNLDLASYITAELAARGLAVDASLVSNTWTAAAWRDAVLNSPVANAFGILSLQGHFSANRLVPADNGQRVLATEIAAVADGRFAGALVYSLGCHSGYSIVNADASNFTQPLAFPEAFVGRGATLVGGTGYQYGETVLMKNSEALLALLTKELGYSTSPTGASYANGVPIGKALLQAKRAYMAQTATPRGIDLKVVNVSTVYGSPTMAFKVPSQHARPSAGTLAPAAVAGFTGLTALNVGSTDALSTINDAGVTYYTAAGSTTTAPYRPIAPLSTIDARVNGSVLQGAVFLGGAYSEIAPFTPRLSIPATEQAGEAPRYANDVFMPVLPVKTNLFDGDAVQVIPFQYRSNALGTSGTARVFGSGVQARAYWSSRTGLSSAADAPVIRDVSVKVESAQLVVFGTLRGLSDPGIAEVWLTYTDTTAASRSFASVPMTAFGVATPDPAGTGFTQLYRATLPGAPSAYRFLVQAVSGNGRVSAATSNGQLYGLPAVQAPAIDTRVASVLALSAPLNATYRSTITATATLTASGQALNGKSVIFTLGGSSRTALTVNGIATATLDVNVTPRLDPYALTAAFTGDGTAFGSPGVSRSITVGKAPTVLETIQASPQYSDGAAVARLRAHGLTLNEQPVIITRGGVSVATATDFAGDVRFDTIDFGAGAGSSTLTIEYPGNARYAGTGLTVTVVVQAENATLALTLLGPQPTGPVKFDALVTQAADGSLGDLTRATVSYTFTSASGSVITATALVDALGASTISVTLPAGLYDVAAKVSGDFTSDVVAMTLPVYDASLFVSGGGWLTTGAGSYGVPIGSKASLGFVAKYKSDGVTPAGNLTVHVKSATGKDRDTDAQAKANGSLKFKATSFDWLVIAGNAAAFTGTATVNGESGYQFRADVVDDTADLFVIHIWDPALSATAGGSYDDPKHIVRGTLGGGSIRINR